MDSKTQRSAGNISNNPSRELNSPAFARAAKGWATRPPLEGVITYEVLNSTEFELGAGLSFAGAIKLSETAEEADEAEIGAEIGMSGLTAEAGVP